MIHLTKAEAEAIEKIARGINSVRGYQDEVRIVRALLERAARHPATAGAGEAADMEPRDYLRSLTIHPFTGHNSAGLVYNSMDVEQVVNDLLATIHRLRATPTAAREATEALHTWPEAIYLQVSDEVLDYAEDSTALPAYDTLQELSWCSSQVFEHDVKYVRADLALIPTATAGAGEAGGSAPVVQDTAPLVWRKEEIETSAHPDSQWVEYPRCVGTGFDVATALQSKTTAPLPGFIVPEATTPTAAPEAPVEAWVSVQDRLPEARLFNSSAMVLCQFFNGNMCVCFYRHTDKTWREHTEGPHMQNITHWRPLPAPTMEGGSRA